MSGGGLTVRLAGPADFPAIARLHRELLGDSQLTRLGAPFLVNLYYPTLVDRSFGGIFLAEYNGEVAGFAAWTIDARTFLDTVANRKAAMGLALAAGFLRHPVEVLGAVLRATSTYGHLGNEPGADIAAEFLTLGVTEKFRDPAFIRQSGVSVAKSLFRAVRDNFAQRGIARFKLFPPAAEAGKPGPALLYRMMGARQTWSGTARNTTLSLFVCDTAADKTC
ncbi:MAG: hypothetical protein HQL42_02350 [Alphaproteobacteria bacterium]|nr:hypothetical protein [Alphaproteobacteria bacterium]